MILFTRNFVMTYHSWISRMLCHKLWLVDTLTVRDRSPSVGPASKNLINHPCPEKGQPTCPSSRRNEWDANIARMNTQIPKLLFSVRHVDCTYAWLKRETVFWSIICSFPPQLHYLFYLFLKINYSCVDFSDSFYHV